MSLHPAQTLLATSVAPFPAWVAGKPVTSGTTAEVTNPYLQVGVFTHDLATAFRAHRELEVGGVMIGDVPSFRADQMPYGGVKSSGVGREGLRSAMADFTYEKDLVRTGLAL